MGQITANKQLPAQQQSNQQQLLALCEQAPPQGFLERGFAQEHWNVLTGQLFPEAKDPNAVLLLLDYCKVRKLDPMQKVFHIVPMKRNGKDVDTILPGVAYYEIVAHRTGQFAGKTPAEYGPLKKHFFKEHKWAQGGYVPTGREISVEAPEWCMVTIKKIVQGVVCEFSSDPIYYTEFAAIAKSTGFPNDNWRNKPRMMMGKCALAAALRLAFPEEVGNLQTREEMEGREVYDEAGEPMPEVTDIRKDAATQVLAQAGQRRRQKAQDKPAPQKQAEEIVEGEVVQQQESASDTAEQQKAEAAEDDDALISPEKWAWLMNQGLPLEWRTPDIERLSCRVFKLPPEDAKVITNKQARRLAAMIAKYPPAKLLEDKAGA